MKLIDRFFEEILIFLTSFIIIEAGVLFALIILVAEFILFGFFVLLIWLIITTYKFYYEF